MHIGTLAVFVTLVSCVTVLVASAQPPAPKTDHAKAESLAKLALAAMAHEDYAAALDLIENALIADPTWAALYYNRAGIQYRRRKLDAAISDCTRALQLAPEPRFAIYALRAMAYQDKGDIDHAHSDLKAALQIVPNHEVMQIRLSWILIEKKQWKDAINLLTRVCRKNPDSYTAWLYRGVAYCQSGEFDKGFLDFEQAEQICPDEIGVPIQRALALYAKHEIDASLTACSKVLKRKPKTGEERYYAAVAYTRGLIFQDDNKVDSAVADFTEAIRLHPSHRLAHLHRGELFYATGNFDKALQDFSKCVNLSPEEPTGYEWRSRTYYTLGDYSKSLADDAKAKSLRKVK